MPPFPESRRCLSLFQENLFPCTASTFKPRIESQHGGPWDNPVGKPRGKPSWETSRESHRFLDPPKGKCDKLLQLGRKADVHAPTRDEDRLPCGVFKSTPRSMSALERNTQFSAPIPHKVLGPSIDGRGIQRGPLVTRMGTGIS